LSGDGIIEAVRHVSLPIYAVQWHPERMVRKFASAFCDNAAPLFSWFADLCAAN
jgi:gamma-glutamyl-gamma-aminobutyrate hydrolase PuuD